MEYTALIFDDCMDETDSFDNLEQAMKLFKDDDRCHQIVVSCDEEWMLKLAHKPVTKMMLVKMATTPYMALLNSLKAVTEENVVVVGLSTLRNQEEIQRVLEALSKYPAVLVDKDLQGYDTRLLMFSIQKAIESNIAIDTYAMAVEVMTNMPLEKV